MNMKKLLESMDNIEECGTNEGMPMVPPALPQPEEDKGNPVTMNVSLNASGKDHVSDLINMMKNAGLKDAGEVSADMMPPRLDMERLRGIVDGPKDMDDLKPGMQGEPCPKCGKVHIGMSACNDSMEMDDEAVSEYDNEPDEQYGSIDDVIDSGDDLHKSKKAYKATQDGDNPMSLEDDIKEQLWAALSNMKVDEGRGRGKKKAKEDIETNEGRGRGKKKAKEDIKTTEARGKLMAGRGRGKKK